ncbi:hypothetical protein [uncultured Draconibacterium sp.]|uniref:hypothetical protein n=1 Tax=uncultured Draconibacterium sp. TaxID=1573823 RepID=UPI0025D8F3AE|nr:hypothetical protein [uncultured Draconibacterium sp.]
MNLKAPDVNWMNEFNGAITVCDTAGIIVYMNRYSVQQFEKYGGEKLIGTNLLDCHPEPAKSRLKEMLANPQENTYTTEKAGKEKIITQRPWMMNEKFAGVVELSFDLPVDMVHHKRD